MRTKWIYLMVLIVALGVWAFYENQPPMESIPEPTPPLPYPDKRSPEELDEPEVDPAASTLNMPDEPDPQFPYYLGVNADNQVTVYHWVDGKLEIWRIFDQLNVDRLRTEELDELIKFVPIESEERLWQKLEGLSH